MKQHNNPHSRPPYRLIVLGCLIILILIFLVWFMWPDLETSWTIFNAENRVNDMYQRVQGMAVAPDLSLQAKGEPITQLGGTMSCVYVGAFLTYRTNNQYDKIINAYKSEFSKMGWQSTPIPNDEREGVAFFPAADRTLIVIVSHPKTTAATSQTVYDVTLDFGEKRCSEFCPEWRCPRK